jgi:CheY-like chemotaxis protein
MATWKSIRNALDFSEELLSSSRRRLSEEASAKCVSLMLAEARRVGADELRVDLADTRATYTIETERGVLEGEIRNDIVNLVSDYLTRASEDVQIGVSLGCSFERVGPDRYRIATDPEGWSRKDLPGPESRSSDRPVWLIDDDPVFRLVLARFLTKKGIISEQFADGRAALRRVAPDRSTPCAIICDLHMPDLDGHEVVRRLRARPELKSTPVIALSTDENPAVELAFLESGADIFLSKRCSPLTILAHIERALTYQRSCVGPE